MGLKLIQQVTMELLLQDRPMECLEMEAMHSLVLVLAGGKGEMPTMAGIMMAEKEAMATGVAAADRGGTVPGRDKEETEVEAEISEDPGGMVVMAEDTVQGATAERVVLAMGMAGLAVMVAMVLAAHREEMVA